MSVDDDWTAIVPRERPRGRSWPFWPYLLSSLVHLGACAAFLQFGSPGTGGGIGTHHDDSLRLVGRFLENVDAAGGQEGGAGPEIRLTAATGRIETDSDEPLAPIDEQEPPPFESVPEKDVQEAAPVEPIFKRLSPPIRDATESTDSVIAARTRPEPVETTVVEDESPAPPRRPARPSGLSAGSSGNARGTGGRAGNAGGGGEGARDGVGFFGLEARARNVVYVIDASSSMETHAAMAQAIAELEASLDSLSPTAKYGIVFFNNVPSLLPVSGSVPPLFANTPRNRRIAQQFISSIVPDAGSDRLAALLAALTFRPDAIFLLTDAGEPPLAAADLEAFRRRNRSRAPVHVVEFGVGVQLVRENFLTRLARQNAGGYRYVDVAAE